MAVISGINDIKAEYLNQKFKICRIVFRNKSKIPKTNNTQFKLSELLNISIIKYKNDIICYCDGVKGKEKIQNYDECNLSDTLEDVILENPFSGYSVIEKEELEEDIEFLYQKEKRDWIRRFSNNDNLKNAIDLNYECDNEYCLERLNKEYPGFKIVNHTTYFYQKSCPSNLALSIEKRFRLQINGSKIKYGTYTRIVQLEKHDTVDYNYEEAIVLFNYLNKFDVFALINIAEDQLNGGQPKCIGS